MDKLYSNSKMRGVSVVEALIAFLILSLSFLSSIVVLFQSQHSITRLEKAESLAFQAEYLLDEEWMKKRMSFDELEVGISTTTYNGYLVQKDVEYVDAYTKRIELKTSDTVATSVSHTAYIHDFNGIAGGDSCNPYLIGDWLHPSIYKALKLDQGNVSEDVVARNGIAYLATNSSLQSAPDVYMLNVRDPQNIEVVSYLNTGPGVAALAVTSNYVYTANTSVNAQLQIIDISDKNNPLLVSSFKLPHSDASTTPGISRSIFYAQNKIYLGTTKNSGNEFHVIDVNDPLNPHYEQGYETGTLVNAIYVKGNRAYLATPNYEQLRVIDLSKNPIALVEEISLQGWQIQEGKTLYPYRDYVYLGRGVGGFNNVNNHELYSFQKNNNSLVENKSIDIASSVNGIVVRTPYIFVATSDIFKELQVVDSQSFSPVKSYDLGGRGVALSCDGNTLYVATEGVYALTIVKPLQ